MDADTNRSMTGGTPSRHNLCVAQTKKTDEGILAGERIRRAYELTGLDRIQLSAKSKILYSTIGNYENGSRRLPIRHAKMMAAVFRLPAAFLMGLIDEEDMEILRAPKKARDGFLATLRAFSGGNASTPAEPRSSPFAAALVPVARLKTK